MVTTSQAGLPSCMVLAVSLWSSRPAMSPRPSYSAMLTRSGTSSLTLVREARRCPWRGPENPRTVPTLWLGGGRLHPAAEPPLAGSTEKARRGLAVPFTFSRRVPAQFLRVARGLEVPSWTLADQSWKVLEKSLSLLCRYEHGSPEQGSESFVVARNLAVLEPVPAPRHLLLLVRAWPPQGPCQTAWLSSV